jgi:hypothetical protein
MRNGIAARAACVLTAIGLFSCGGNGHADERSIDEVQSAYTDPPEPQPAQWICDLPINASWSIYAPHEEEEYLNECLFHTDYDANVLCVSTTGRGCCMTQTYHSHSVSYANQTWYCSAHWMGWRHL